MKILLKIKGQRGFDEVEIDIEKDLVIGSGIRFLLHNTKFSATGEVVTIDEVGRRIHVKSLEFNDWIGFEAVADVMTPDEFYNFKLQSQIDHGIEQD